MNVPKYKGEDHGAVEHNDKVCPRRAFLGDPDQRFPHHFYLILFWIQFCVQNFR